MAHAARRRAGASLALACALVSTAALAGPADYVHMPTVEEGEREVEFRAGTARNRDGSRESEYGIGLGYGLTSWWAIEFQAKWHKPAGEPHDFDAWELENRFQLTETGKYPVDLGFLLEIERPKDRAEGYEIKWGPLLQTEFGTRVQANLNLLIEKHVRAENAGKAELGYEWQLKYRWRPAFEFGAQGFGDVGPWDHWEPHAEQPHKLGPAVFGEFHLGGRRVFKYNAGLMFGITDAAPRQTLRLQAEYEF